MLQQPMKEKLYALKLQGMAQALEHQEQDEAARELSFIDRLALLVDQQWNWRQNQALTRRVLAARLWGTACVIGPSQNTDRHQSGMLIDFIGIPRLSPLSRWNAETTTIQAALPAKL